MNLFAELRRRNVFRVAAAYAVVAWLLIQAADILLDNFGAPEWVFKSFAALLLLGFPLALFLSWAYELTPEGVKRSDDVTAADSVTPRTGRRIDRLIVVGLLAVIAVLVVERMWFADHEREPVAGKADRAASDLSIAVLPFVYLSADPEDEYFADGLTEEILNSLAALTDLLVTARTSSFYFKGKDVPLEEIAERLGVAHVVEGSVRRSGDKVRVTAQLIRAKDGFHLWSQSYDRPLDDVFEVQTDIAEKVAGALSIYLDNAQREAIGLSGTRNVEAFKAFLKGRALYARTHTREPGVSLWNANEEFERAMALDPGYAAPALYHHDAYAHYLMDGPDHFSLKEPRGRGPASEEEALERLLADLDRAIETARTPTTRIDAQLTREMFSQNWSRMRGLLARFHAEGVIEEEGSIDIWLSSILSLNEEFETRLRLSDHRIRTDPLDPLVWWDRVVVFVNLGDLDAAEDAIRSGRAAAGDSALILGSEVLVTIARRDREKFRALMKRLAGEQERDIGWRDAYLAAIEGDYDRATRLTGEIEAASVRPVSRLLWVYHETGDKARATALTRRADALTMGPTILARDVTDSGNMLYFDLVDAPNFAARLEEAGIDRKNFRPMPRLSAGLGADD